VKLIYKSSGVGNDTNYPTYTIREVIASPVTRYYTNSSAVSPVGAYYVGADGAGPAPTVEYLKVTNWIGDASKVNLTPGYVTTNGSGSSLTSLDLNPSLTATVAKAAAALTNITASQIVAAGGVTNVYNDPVLTSSNLLGFAGTTCTITRAMGNALNLTPTGTVYFAADATLTDTNVVAGFTLDLFYNAQTFGFVGASMTNTATLTSNAWNSIIFWKGRGSSVFVGK
jgi:hypothetical protein